MESTLLLFVLSLGIGGCWGFAVEGYAGSSIIIKCKYKDEHRDQNKYFCKDDAIGGKYLCDTQIQTEGNKGWQTKGRFSLYDNTDGGFLKVIMRNLTKSDEGKYWCGVQKTFLDDYTEVNLKVKEGKEEVYRVSGYVGDDITIKCKYEDTNKHKSKYLCKNTAVGCEDRIRTDRKDQWESRDRFSLYDDTTGGFFMINITKVTEEDYGTYWCALDEPPSNDSKVSVDQFKTIQLDVHTGSPVVLPVSMTIVVLGFGIVFFICVMCQKRRGREPSFNHSGTVQDNDRARAPTDGVYEEIQDTSISVYALAQLPTNPSCDPTYSTVQLHTSPGGDPSYSTVQLPADPSEDPGYASGTFQKIPSSETS
ncbi:polymeric immunoglobulin receptor-like [Alosa sapidissima]|uniref:polymeric immunoglobulin receptor-like n=1 Tax=Alosa sapidissima TaxID=34773 RepID=UPI001C09AB69|nr:polymeric immunoglobulin receptor-like [Alosa sapidissima]